VRASTTSLETYNFSDITFGERECGFTSGLRHHRFATLVQSDPLKSHENRRCANELDYQMVRKYVDRVNKILNQNSPD
jgi:hypothetical protein